VGRNAEREANMGEKTGLASSPDILTIKSFPYFEKVRFSFFCLFIHLFICAYIVWAISLLPSHPFPLPQTHLDSNQNLFCPLLKIC
jgi:hypothetical protein